MPLKPVSYSGRVGEVQIFICLPCYFLSLQKIRAFLQHPAAGSSKDELAMHKEAFPSTPSPPPAAFSISYLILLLQETVKNGFWVTSCMLLSFLTFAISSKYYLSFFSKAVSAPKTIVLL